MIRDLIVNRSAFDRIIQAGGFISATENHWSRPALCSSHLTRIPGSKWIGPDPSLVGVHVPQDLADGGYQGGARSPSMSLRRVKLETIATLRIFAWKTSRRCMQSYQIAAR